MKSLQHVKLHVFHRLDLVQCAAPVFGLPEQRLNWQAGAGSFSIQHFLMISKLFCAGFAWGHLW